MNHSVDFCDSPPMERQPVAPMHKHSLQPRRPVRRLAGCVAAIVAAGCTAGSGEGLDISGRPVEEGGDLPLAATLPSLQANVFDPFCIVCHSGAAAPLGLRLDAGASFNSLVGVRSRQGGLLRVEPGRPDSSYLVRKLEGTSSEGGQMPLGGPPLPQSTIDFVRQWILDGALPDAPAPAGQPPVITAVDPAPGSSLSALPATIDIGFDREIDAATVHAMTIELLRSGGDGSFGDADDVSVTAAGVSLSPVNPRLATIDLSGAPGTDDTYRLTVRGSGPSLVLSIEGIALDGEFSGSLPSGDGAEGGDFVANFTVQGLQPTLDSIQANLLGPTCAVSGCHEGPTGPNLPGGMDLTTADASFRDLVGADSLQVPTLKRVAAGDADNSYLVRKLEGTASVGGRMPQGGPFLDQSTVDVIRAWIDSGAPR